MTRAKRLTVKTLRPLDGGSVGDELHMNSIDAKRLEKRGLVEIVGDAPDEEEAEDDSGESKSTAPAENKDASQAPKKPANKAAAPKAAD